MSKLVLPHAAQATSNESMTAIWQRAARRLRQSPYMPRHPCLRRVNFNKTRIDHNESAVPPKRSRNKLVDLGLDFRRERSIAVDAQGA
jgi:hypothetical protein